MMHMKEIGDFLQSLRKSKGLTQQELADMINVSNKTVSKWENGLGMPEMSTLLLLADIYQVTVDDLLRGSKKMQKSDDKPLERFTYMIQKSKHQYLNHFLLAIGMILLGVLAYFITKEIAKSTLVPIMVSLVFVVSSGIIHVFNLIRVHYQMIECHRDTILKSFFRHIIFSSLLLIGLGIWLIIFTILHNASWIKPSNEATLYASILPALAIASIHVLIIYIILLIIPKFSFNIKPSLLQSIMLSIYILIILLPFIILSIFPTRNVAITLEWTHMGQSYAYIDQQEAGYYRLRLLSMIDDEIKNGRRPDEIYEVRQSPDLENPNLMVYYHFTTPTDYELWIELSYFEDFLMEQGYSNFEVTDTKISAYTFSVNDTQLTLEIYGYIFGILVQMWIYINIGLLIILRFRHQRKKLSKPLN